MKRLFLAAMLVSGPAWGTEPPKPPVVLPSQVRLTLTPEQLDLIAKAVVGTITRYEVLMQTMQSQTQVQAVGPAVDSEPSGF